MKSYRAIVWAIGVAAALVLAGCGGGGGGRDDNVVITPTDPGAARGFWQDSAGDLVVVIGDGSIWGLLNTNNTGNNNADDDNNLSIMHGYLANSETGTVNVLPIGAASNYSTSIAVSANAQQTLNIVPSSSPQSWYFDGSYQSGYDPAASLRKIQGTYSGYISLTRSSASLATDSAQINISENIITLSATQYDCSVSGTIMPRRDISIFAVTMKFQGGACAFSSGTSVNGIAFSDENGALRILATTNNQQTGFLAGTN
jgi:hypothetical protein